MPTTYTSDVGALAAACVDAPDDEAPRGILFDCLLDHPDQTLYANWNWYWNDLIPGFRQMLAKPKIDLSPMPRLGADGPRVAYSGLKQGGKDIWPLAVLRTAVDLGGDPLWPMISRPFTRIVAWAEVALCLCENREVPPLPAMARTGSHREILADDCVNYLPRYTNGALDLFQNILASWMINSWYEENYLSLESPGAAPAPKEKYEPNFLFPTWLQGTILYTSKSYRKHLKLLKEMYSPT